MSPIASCSARVILEHRTGPSYAFEKPHKSPMTGEYMEEPPMRSVFDNPNGKLSLTLLDDVLGGEVNLAGVVRGGRVGRRVCS